ncbi:MAG TPA: response regulator [Gemmataceae bacterium]|jgi:signal transduction histidine kinase/CheY-like chemotaxis protein|nr:response regulator [Gemmataceae bacterium]
MTPIDTARSREPASRPSEDFTRAALSFVHDMVTQAEQTPLKLEHQLAKLARAFRASSAGAAGLVGGTQAFQIEISADGHSLPGLSWPADKWLQVASGLQNATALVMPSASNRSLLLSACTPQAGATWLFWLEDEGQRIWQKGEQSALHLAGLVFARLIIEQSRDERWNSWLEKAKRQELLENAALVVGKLAHDFNNVLTGILGFAELCLGQLQAGSLPHQFASEVYQSAQKGSKFTSQLSNFSRRSTVRSQPTCLANVVKAELARVEKTWGQAVGIRVEVPDELSPAAVDDTGLRLILGQLLDNAREAIACAGTVAVLARQVELTRSDCLELFGRPAPGICLEMSVADTGSGFTAEAKRRALVEPFFSTKPRHRGLGLASIYGLLYAHGGGLRIQHGDPSGTVVHVYLPVVRQKTPVQPIRRSAIPLPRGERVLVVDDDPLTLRLMCTTLERAGYQVQPAADGVQALECYAKAEEPFGLVLSDVVMPRMTGFDLAQHLLERDPHVNVLFTSGHIPAGFIPEGFAGRNFDLLPKPFRPEGLIRAVRVALEKESPSLAP